ncbi:MAG: fimbrillin family protein [Bacteroidales bacterium]|nr:fimbrillin family protein [Bacteroidales bacterium]
MKKSLIITLMLAFLLISCSKQESTDTFNTKSELAVKVGILPTKAIISGTIFPNGSSIGVQVRKTDQFNYQAGTMTNIMYTYTAAGATWATATPFYLTNTLGEVYAYYPYVSVGDNLSAFTTIPVTIDATATTGTETDYMYATPLTGVNSVSNEVGKQNANLVMNHAFTQISFYIYKNNYSGTGVLTQFKIEDAAATTFVKTSSTAMTMNIENGNLVGGATGIITRTLATPVTLTSVAPDAAILVLKTQVNATTILVPTASMAIGDIKFTFTIDGETYTATNTTAISWLKGKQYIYTARLDGTGLVILSAIITDWDTQPGDLIDIK